MAARGALLRLPYGDQGLLIPRRLYRQLGGYKPLPLMEDVEFMRRIGRRRTVSCGRAPPALWHVLMAPVFATVCAISPVLRCTICACQPA